MSRAFAVTIASLVLLVTVATVAHLTPVSSAQPGPSQPAVTPTPTAGCVVVHAKRAAPLTVTLGSTVDVTLTARLTCTAEPEWLHVVLVLESSSAMSGAPVREMQRAAGDLVRHLDLPNSPATFVGVVSFNDTATRHIPLSNDERRVLASLNPIGTAGGSEIDRGLAEADRVLQQGRAARAPDEPTEVVVLFSRGLDDNGCEDAVRKAQALKGKGVLIVAVGVADDRDERCLRQIASSSRYYYPVEDLPGILRLFDYVTNAISNTIARVMVVTDTLGADVEYVDDSANPTPAAHDPGGRWYRWQDYWIPRQGVTYSLKVRPLRTGRIATNALADGYVIDNKGRALVWTFDVPFVTVIDAAPSPSPSPTASLTPGPSPTSPRSTLTPTPGVPPGETPSTTPTDTPVPSATVAPDQPTATSSPTNTDTPVPPTWTSHLPWVAPSAP